ncbi:aroma-sacti cluster domain-containing protein [Thermoactinospora rubra]|uniref:aroma-sacti cluster domain-containing protein n=1 Tax=Thermoactinospora rubra TaxID=1088767 RepID=UPI000A0F65AE|nr:aroma-sacti cluster domain-containing protein [Thermoactinospora rubra]
MSDDPLAPLRAAGLDRLPEAQRAVFEQLTPEEMAVVSSIQERLNAAAPDVEGQGNLINSLC